MQKRNLIWLVGFILVIIAISASGVFAANLLTNPGMESGTTGWTGYNCTIASNTTTYHAGLASILVSGRASASAGLAQDITSLIVSGAPFTNSVWVKTLSAKLDFVIEIKVTASGSGTTSFITPFVGCNATTWTLVSGSLTPTWTGTLQSALWIVHSNNNTGSFYADDATFDAGTAPPPTPTTTPTATRTPTPSGPQPTPTTTPTPSGPVPTPTATVTPSVLPTPTNTGNYGVTTICTWKDNKISAFTPTYDDGLWNSIIQVDPIQTQHHITGSLCINTADFDANFGTHWVDLQAMAQRGVFDLNSHTNTHLHLIKATAAEMDAEFEASNNMIFNRTGFKAEAIADPFNETNAAVKVEEAKYYVCARQGNFNSTYPVSPDTTDYYGLYADVFSRDSLTTMKGWVDSALSTGTWCIINFHGVGNDGWQPCPLADLDGLFAYVESKFSQIWNAGLPAIGKYIRERQNSTVTIQSSTSSQIILSLTNSLVNTQWFTFNQPLTLKTCVPSNWTSATIIQGSTQVTKPAVTEGSSKYVYFDALPNLGLITLNGN